ncbi:MAG: HprK-related kinase B [Desulfarculales bacterium]|jgi:HprK-related kinase B|nr:HprK-related kinase B [Desulfarculales bacterium]
MNFSCAEFIASTRAKYPVTEEIILDFGDIAVRVEMNSPELCAYLYDYFSEFVENTALAGKQLVTVSAHETGALELDLPFISHPAGNGKNKIKESFLNAMDGRLVRKNLTGLIMAFNGQENLVVGRCLDNSNQVVNFINNRLIEQRLNHGCYLGHAAAVSLSDYGLALAGFSGMGKSTLALHLMNEGCTFISNDRVMLSPDPEPVLYGVAKQPRINPGTALANAMLHSVMSVRDRRHFSSLPQDILWAAEHKYDALIGKCYGAGRFKLQSHFGGLVVLNWRRTPEPTEARLVNAKERPDLVKAFVKETGLFFWAAAGGAHRDPPADAYAARLSKAPMIEISGGVNFSQATAFCLDFLQNHGDAGSKRVSCEL